MCLQGRCWGRCLHGPQCSSAVLLARVHCTAGQHSNLPLTLPPNPAPRRPDFERHRALPLPRARGGTSSSQGQQQHSQQDGEGPGPARGSVAAAAAPAAMAAAAEGGSGAEGQWMPAGPSAGAGEDVDSLLRGARAQQHDPVGPSSEEQPASVSSRGYEASSEGDDTIGLGPAAGEPVGSGEAAEASDDQIGFEQGRQEFFGCMECACLAATTGLGCCKAGLGWCAGCLQCSRSLWLDVRAGRGQGAPMACSHLAGFFLAQRFCAVHAMYSQTGHNHTYSTSSLGSHVLVCRLSACRGAARC